LIIEPDRGQSEAINKGLKIADGKLLTWLNSDDMLAPGALHMAAFSWKKSEADVIAGICAEHDNRRIGTINKPAARDGDFNTEQLSLIYERWLQGWFFNQPEVFFSKALVEKFGMLDESLEYTMDYDLWLRFAAGGARLAVTDWPFAFFRRHPAQKTHHLLRAIHEQAKVRSRYLKSFPCPANILQTARKLQKLRRKGIVSVAAQGLIHDCELSTPAKAFLQSLIGSTVKIVPASSDWADVVFLVAQEKHADGQPPAAHLESNGQLVIAWFEENLGDPFAAYELACAADIVGGKDESQLDYLRNSKSVFASDLAAHKDALAELI